MAARAVFGCIFQLHQSHPVLEDSMVIIHSLGYVSGRCDVQQRHQRLAVLKTRDRKIGLISSFTAQF